MKKKISVVSGCFNEEENVEDLYNAVFTIANKYPEYEWEQILIDNCSTDKTPEVLERLASKDKRFKAIFNIRNFGHIRSPHYAILQSTGDAVITLASDLQDPPELIEKFIQEWSKGSKVVVAIKQDSDESFLFHLIRTTYYKLVARLSDVDLLKNFNGFGLYDREVIEHIRSFEDPYPYFRGMISELGYPPRRIYYKLEKRKRGFSKNNLYTLYDIGMLGFTNHTKIPLRLAMFVGFAISLLLFICGLGYLIAKLIFWNSFQLGTAPVILGLFFIGAIQLMFLGIIGEYIGAIQTRQLKRPLIVEKRRLNLPPLK